MQIPPPVENRTSFIQPVASSLDRATQLIGTSKYRHISKRQLRQKKTDLEKICSWTNYKADPSGRAVLRRRSAAKRLLRSRVQILPGAWTFVSCECLCCPVEVSATGRSLVQRSPADCGVCFECDQVKNKNPPTCCEQVHRRGKDYVFCRADPSSRGVLPTVVSVSVWSSKKQKPYTPAVNT
jgi:hypothetical protein